MRKHTFLLALALSFFATTTIQAQQTLTPLEMKGRKITHDGVRVKSAKDLEQIIYQAHDVEADRLLQEFKNMRTVGTIVMVGGVGLETAALIGQLKGGGGSSTLMLGGAAVLLTGAIIQAVGWSSKGKAAVRRYNAVVVPEAPVSWRLEAAPAGLGIGLALRF